MTPFLNKRSIKPEFVARPNWGSFRDFWTDCEMTITPLLAGFIDIEGGHVGIAGKWLDTCRNCPSEITCKDCGRKPSNYLQVRAGDGDGCYSVFEIHFDEKAVGALVILDERGQFAPAIANSIADTLEQLQSNPQVLESFYIDLYQYFYNSISGFDRSLDMYEISDIKVEQNPIYKLASGSAGIFVIGESGEGIDSNQSLVTINNIPSGNYRTFIFANREPENNNILVPRVLLTLLDAEADRIGLKRGFACSINLKEEYSRWEQSTVMARIGEPLAIPVILANANWSDIRFAREQTFEEVDVATALDMKMEGLSWLLLLQANSPSSEISEIITQGVGELGLNLETIHKARGQLGRIIVNY